jgi:three-Cys-motif partner protein
MTGKRVPKHDSLQLFGRGATMAVTAEQFFETQHTPSQVKSAIASDYFEPWSRIMTKRARQSVIGYADLFAGRGRFEDGSESTPMFIARKAVAEPGLRNALKTFFNDKDPDEIRGLQQEIAGIPGIERLVHAPRFSHEAVSPDIAGRLLEFRVIPTFLFADPFGYMGISLKLLRLVLENQKSEALIFFNTNRINAGISNEFVREHIDALFGPKRAEAVRAKVAGLHGDDRERIILDSFQEGLKAIGFPYVLRFRFLSRTADRTSHHLVHCSRHPLAEKIMKEVMDRYSVKSFDGVPLFEIPQADFGQQSLFEEPLPPVDLAQELLGRFSAQTLTLPDVMLRHSPGTPYIERNYRAALFYLIDQGKVTCNPPADEMPLRKGKRIWPKGTKIVFPAQ